MRFTHIFFDLDDTLYSSDNGLWEAIRVRMNQYMIERLGLPADQVPALRRNYFEKYGTTLRGLQIHHRVEADDYLAYVHDLPLEKYLHPTPELRTMLLSLPQTRWIFTNADADHAARVLEKLGLTGCFEGIIDIRLLGFACKPEVIAYQRALALAGSSDPTRCVLIDDSARNLEVARQLGFTTVLVSWNGHVVPWVDRVITNLLELPAALPELWNP